jgi:hypothetical protein
MLGNLYVAAKYWAYGYSDGMANAGGAKRRRYEIDGRIYWAAESELPGLIAAIVAKPVKAAPPSPRARRKAAKRAPGPTPARVSTPVAEARLERLQADFTRRADDTLLLALAEARARLEAQEDDDMTALLLT